MKLLRTILVAAVTSCVAAFGPVATAAYPEKAIEIIVPFAPGGSTDLGARIFAKALQAKWKVPVSVVNVPGGNAAPAIERLMSAPPDGYTVMMDGMSSSSLVSIVIPNFRYKITDRTFMTLAMEGPMVLAVSTDGKYKTLNDLVAEGRKDPKALSWTSVGGVGTLDLAFRKLFKSAGIDVTQTRPVVSKGGSEGAAQVVGGHVVMGAGSFGTYNSFVSAKKAVILAVFSNKRSRLAPEIPTTIEQGFPNSDAIQWNGFSGPPNVPADITQKWNATIKELSTDPEVVAALSRIGAEPDTRDGGAMRKIVDTDMKELGEYFGDRAPR